MPKGPILTPEVTGLIASVHRKHPKWKAPEIRNWVIPILHEDNPNLPPQWPTLSTVQKVLAPVRKKEKELADSSEDKPWNLDALRDDPLPPEVLLKLFPIWLMKQENPLSPPLSIREARWIAQLSSMTDDIELLRIIADLCAEWELIGELTNTPQLSSPDMVLHIYSLLTRMAEKELKEHHQEILREKYVSDTRRGETIKGLGAIYGDEFLKAMKLKSKKEEEGGTK